MSDDPGIFTISQPVVDVASGAAATIDAPPAVEPTPEPEPRGFELSQPVITVIKALTIGDRLHRLEHAIAVHLGLDLGEWDPQSVKDAREKVERAALERFAAVAEQAAKDIAKPLSDHERIQRLEAALRSGGTLE